MHNSNIHICCISACGTLSARPFIRQKIAAFGSAPMTSHTPRDIKMAALWMSGAIFSFTSMAIAGRAVASSHDTFELMLYRSLFGIVIVLLVCSVTGKLGEIKARRMGLHLLRNISHFTGQNLWFFAITVIPLAQVIAIEFTSPLWVMLLAALLLGEKITYTRVIAAAFGFIGVLMVAQPSPSGVEPGVIFAAAAAIGFAGSAIFTKLLVRTESMASILFWLTVMQAIFGLIAAGYDGDIALPSATSAPLLAVIGACGLLAHFCLTSALRLAPASVVMPIDFLRLPIVTVVGALLYAEALNIWVLLGGALIIVANFTNLRLEARAKPVPPVTFL